MSNPCCDNSNWGGAADLSHLIGDFKDRNVEDMTLLRCSSCGAYSLDVTANKGKTYLIPVPKKRGEEMHEADLKFWKSLRSWARS